MAQNNTLDVKDIMSRKNPPVVHAGEYAGVTIKSYEVMEVRDSQFVRFTFKLADGREISDNRFAAGLGVMISHLREQMNLQDVEITGEELFEKCKTQPFKIWVEKATIFNANTGLYQRVTNINFLKPLNDQAQPEGESVESDAIPN